MPAPAFPALFLKISTPTPPAASAPLSAIHSYLLALIGDAIWDLTAGLILNGAKVIAGKIINSIPGVNVLRAQYTEFITGNKFLSTTTVGGSTIKSFVQGILAQSHFPATILVPRLPHIYSLILPWSLLGQLALPAG